jgi:hypothetical protein
MFEAQFVLNLFLLQEYKSNNNKNEFWTLNIHVKQKIYVSISSPVISSQIKISSMPSISMYD